MAAEIVPAVRRPCAMRSLNRVFAANSFGGMHGVAIPRDAGEQEDVLLGEDLRELGGIPDLVHPSPVTDGCATRHGWTWKTVRKVDAMLAVFTGWIGSAR